MTTTTTLSQCQHASMEQIGEGEFVVFNEVTGLPVYENPDDDFPVIKKFNEADGLETVLDIERRYASIR